MTPFELTIKKKGLTLPYSWCLLDNDKRRVFFSYDFHITQHVPQKNHSSFLASDFSLTKDFKRFIFSDKLSYPRRASQVNVFDNFFTNA